MNNSDSSNFLEIDGGNLPTERFGRVEMWAAELGVSQGLIRQKLKGIFGVTGRDKNGNIHKRAYYSETAIRRVLAGQLWQSYTERLKKWIETHPTHWVQDVDEKENDEQQLELVSWLTEANKLFLEDKLPRRCVNALEESGFAFGGSEQWNKMFIETKSFKEKNNAMPSLWTRNAREFMLAVWAQEQRKAIEIKRNKKINQITSEEKQIRSIGIDDRESQIEWMKMHSRILNLFKRGTLHQSKNYNKCLRWFEEQENLRITKQLDREHAEYLREIAFCLDVKQFNHLDITYRRNADEFALAEFIVLHNRYPNFEKKIPRSEVGLSKWIHTCGRLAHRKKLPKIVRQNLADLGIHFLVLGDTFAIRQIRPY